MRTYLFDFDGTLVDSMPTYAANILHMFDIAGVEPPTDIIKTVTPLGLIGTTKYLTEDLGMKIPADEMLAEFHRFAISEYENNIPAKSNVIDVLKQLKERGDDLNVLTASPHSMLDPCLKRLGIYDLFTNVWSCEDFGTTKADPEIYRMAAALIGQRVEDIMFLDDNYNADMVARSAGMKVCGVYDASSAEYTDDIRSVSDCYIYDFSELPDLL